MIAKSARCVARSDKFTSMATTTSRWTRPPRRRANVLMRLSRRSKAELEQQRLTACEETGWSVAAAKTRQKNRPPRGQHHELQEAALHLVEHAMTRRRVRASGRNGAGLCGRICRRSYRPRATGWSIRRDIGFPAGLAVSVWALREAVMKHQVQFAATSPAKF